VDFNIFIQTSKFALCCVGALAPPHPCEALTTRAGFFLGHAAQGPKLELAQDLLINHVSASY
jgi:hypothetical protein